MLAKFLIIPVILIISANAQDESSKSVIIVGAGLAGYSAAARLLEKGFTDITILEAENRVGGRIHSIPYSDGKIDLGAQWVHGQTGNIIYQTAKDFPFGTTLFDSIDQLFVSSSGLSLDQDVLNELSKLVYAAAENYNDEMKVYNGPLGNFIWEKFLESLAESPYANIDANLLALFKNHIFREIVGHHAAESLDQVSARLNSKYDDAKGNQHQTWKKSGFFTYFDYITKKGTLNIAAKTLLNKKVKNINYNLASSTEKVTVETTDSSVYHADYVIVTVSLGVLKKYHTTLFTPALPADKIKAIDKNAFGAIAKVFLHSTTPFWPTSDFISYSFLWSDEQRAEAIAQNRGWLLGVPAFFTVDQYPNLFEGFIGGDKVKEYENTPDEKVLDDIVWLFQKFTGQTIERPQLVGRTNWATNENFLGTYSYLSMDAEQTNTKSKDLAKSLKNAAGKPVVLFAGEAADWDFPSFAHGAVTSGTRAADDIVAFQATFIAPPPNVEPPVVDYVIT